MLISQKTGWKDLESFVILNSSQQGILNWLYSRYSLAISDPKNLNSSYIIIHN